MALIDPAVGGLDPIETPYTDIDGLQAAGNTAVFRGASPSEPAAIVRLNVESGETERLRSAATLADDLRPYLSSPQSISFPTAGGQAAHAFYYPPHNPDFAAPQDEKPPLIVISHGGPTSAASNALSLAKQYWTSRGFAIVDVNYSGSSGYGREYRKRLNGNWALLMWTTARTRPSTSPVKDSSTAAGSSSKAAAPAAIPPWPAWHSETSSPPERATTASATWKRWPATPTSSSRATSTGLVGPYPEARDAYVERSPIHAADKLSAPIIFFQGSEDRVVPPSQTETMVEALRAKGTPAAYLLFAGEQHGFRNGDNVKRALDAELYFYAAILLKKGIRF